MINIDLSLNKTYFKDLYLSNFFQLILIFNMLNILEKRRGVIVFWPAILILLVDSKSEGKNVRSTGITFQNLGI
jgi:hypothetical protein